AVSTRPSDAKLANGLVADLRTQLTQSLMPRRNITRVWIHHVNAGERELVAALCHDMASTPRRAEVPGIGIRLGRRVADGRDALDFEPFSAVVNLDLKFASQDLDE